MTQKYWEQFQATGKVEDYLCYKMGEFHSTAGHGVAEQAETGAMKRESDDRDRNGAFHGTNCRI